MRQFFMLLVIVSLGTAFNLGCEAKTKTKTQETTTTPGGSTTVTTEHKVEQSGENPPPPGGNAPK